MKIFVGYGYNERDEWIERHVFGLVAALGAEPVSGKELNGKILEEGVRHVIRGSDAMLGFLTRRDSLKNGKFSTHQWVQDELVVAREANIPFLEIRETGIDDQGGLLGGRQHLLYDASQREKCLIEIAKTIGLWYRSIPIKLQLLPEIVARAIRPHMKKPGFRCSYEILQQGIVSSVKDTQVFPIKGGLFVLVPKPDPLALIQITVEAGGKAWCSEFESLDSISIKLGKA